MSSKKILVIFGATGNQGASVINAILNDPVASEEYQIYAITRDPSKPSAAVLTEKGVTVLKADLDNKDSLRTVMKDAYAVFAVTNFQEHLSKEREIQQGKNIADIAKECEVQHLIWSSLPNVSKLSNNTLTKVLHFDGKAVVEEYIRSLGIPATFLHLGVFMSYLGFMLSPASTEGKAYVLAAPMPSTTKMPLISVKKDTGLYVRAILANRERDLVKTFSAAEAWYTLDEIVAIMRKEAGLDVTLVECSDEEYRAGLASKGLPEFFQDDMSQNAKWIAEWGFFGPEKGLVETGHEILSEPLETLREWVIAGGLAALT